MIDERPRTLLLIALALMLFGWVMPFLMVIKAVESTFTLNFLSWGASVAGLYLGVMAVAGLAGRRKK